jgi:hypothetical protein
MEEKKKEQNERKSSVAKLQFTGKTIGCSCNSSSSCPYRQLQVRCSLNSLQFASKSDSNAENFALCQQKQLKLIVLTLCNLRTKATEMVVTANGRSN